jgi:putative transcriptional regulator
MTQSLVGNLLVASTLVTDSVFTRGVCLMMHHDENGAIAVMLNRPIWPPPAELIKMIVGRENDSQDGPESSAGALPASSASATNRIQSLIEASPTPAQIPSQPSPSSLIHFGGPLSGPVLAIHGNMALAEAQTGAGIYVAAQKEHLEQLVREKPGNYRLIIGHAAWASGQLDQEIEAGVWHVLPATAEMVFGVDADLWPLLIRRATGSTLARLVGAPDNPIATALN